MSAQERVLIREHTLADPDYANRLQEVPGQRQLVGRYTLDDLEDLIGYVSAEANQTEDPKLQNRLDSLSERLYKIQRSYDDGSWADSDT